MFPARRLVGYCGSPASQALGQMGVGDLSDRGRELVRDARPYADGRRVLPVVELIATLVHGEPGADGMYRTRVSERTIRDYLTQARRIGGLLLLNIQPGRASFIDELQAYERFLREPDVGAALDPEWSVQSGQVPGEVFGSTTGADLDECARYLAGLVRRGDLPEKVMVYHQLHASIVREEKALRPHRGVALVKSVDGIGDAGDKTKDYRQIMATTPRYVHPGFKLFFTEDRRSGPLMTPAQVLGLHPRPEYVLYE